MGGWGLQQVGIGMMEGLLVSNIPFLGDFLDPPLDKDDDRDVLTYLSLRLAASSRSSSSFSPAERSAVSFS